MDFTEALATVSRVHHLFAVLFLVYVVYKLSVLLLKRKAAFRGTECFPGPPGHWLFGHVLEFKQDGKDFDRLMEWIQEFPYAFPMWFGPFTCFLNIHHPDYAKTILASTEPKDDVAYRFIKTWIGDGLLVSKGQKWFRHRRLLTRGFHYDILKQYIQLMSDSTQVMLRKAAFRGTECFPGPPGHWLFGHVLEDKWESYGNTNESFELFEHVSLMTLDNILKCAFSYNSNCQTESGTNAYIQSVYELSSLVNLRFRTFPYHNDLIFYLSPHGFRFRKACRIAQSHTEDVIRKRKEALKEEKELDRIQAKRNLDFLDILLCARDENQQGLSDEDLRAEVDTFMFEGHDTTSSGITFTLYCLACNPEHQQKCRDEITEVLQGKDTMEWDDLNKIPYTTMCIKESLRLYPPVPGMARKTTKPMTFCDGRTLPEGSLVGTSIYGMHMNPAVWENPYVFDPLRFLPENVSKRSPHAFVPFSAGPRNCIGQTFAMNEMKVATALTLRRYMLTEDPTCKPKIIARLVMRSLSGVHIKIKPVAQV